MKIQAKLNREPKILAYRLDERLTVRMGKDYKVGMGFGLHIGWGIEGAIGSEFKIDASYLSPNVNMASRLEAATK
jgi:class 3 adenylate cyclase